MNGDESLHEWLADHAFGSSVRRYMEIGVRDGDSLRCVIENATALEVVYMCDTWGSEYGGTGRGDHSHIDRMLDGLAFFGGRVYLTGDSKETLPNLSHAWADLILVDGDHSEAGAQADLENCQRFLSQGGRIVFHDTNHQAHPGLRQVFLNFVIKHGLRHWFCEDGHGFGVAWKDSSYGN